MSDLQGTIHHIYEAVNVSQTFSKREFILKTLDNPDYPQYVKLEFTKDKCDLLDKYKPGQEVKVAYNIRGREWINKEGVKQYFNTVQAWRIELLSKEVEGMPYKMVDPEPAGFEPGPGEDGLPF